MNEEMEQLKADNEAMKNEILHLKHQLAGSKGRNKQLTEEIKRLKEDITASDSVIKTMRYKINEQDAQYCRLSLENSDFRAMIEWYNDLPWYKKIFISRFETCGD